MSPPRLPPLHRYVLLLVAVLSPAVGSAQSPFTSLTFFGDSYSDTGNLYQLSEGFLPPSPPYAIGRYSNGPVWVDYFAQALGRPADAAPSFVAQAASGNYAIAGARTRGGIAAISTQTQVAAYLSRPGATPGTLTDPTGLYTLFAGGNDLNDIGRLADPAARAAAAVAAAQNVVTQAGLLAGAGARRVLLFTLPSLGRTPRSQAVPGLPAIDDQLVATFDATLDAGITGLGGTFGSTTFLNFRLDNLFYNVLRDADTGGRRYGLTNVTAPCLLQAGAPPCAVSVFADSLHPTTRTHEFIAEAAFRYVTIGQNVAVVPEPATWVLLGTGLLAVGGTAASRRRAAARREVRGRAARVLARGLVAREQDSLRDEPARFARQSEREQNVLRLTAQGYTAPGIGERLTISPEPLDTYTQRVDEKLRPFTGVAAAVPGARRAPSG